jgi:hypothetical protein
MYEYIRKSTEYPIYKHKRISAYPIDETVNQIGNQNFWLWLCIEPVHRSVLVIHISEERNMFVVEDSLDLLSRNIVDIQVILMVEHGILHKHISSYI